MFFEFVTGRTCLLFVGRFSLATVKTNLFSSKQSRSFNRYAIRRFISRSVFSFLAFSIYGSGKKKKREKKHSSDRLYSMIIGRNSPNSTRNARSREAPFASYLGHKYDFRSCIHLTSSRYNMQRDTDYVLIQDDNIVSKPRR